MKEGNLLSYLSQKTKKCCLPETQVMVVVCYVQIFWSIDLHFLVGLQLVYFQTGKAFPLI